MLKVIYYYVILLLYYCDLIYPKWDISLYFSTISTFSAWNIIFYHQQEKTHLKVSVEGPC